MKGDYELGFLTSYCELIMTKVFLYGNSFKISQMIYDINFLTNIDAAEIILLSDIKRLYYTNSEIACSFYNTPLECVEKSDIVIVLKDKIVPPQIISMIIEYSIKKRKKYYIVDETIEIDNLPRETIPEKFSTKPVVLCVSFGAAAASLNCELLIERAFQNDAIKTWHIFSEKNMRMIENLKKNGLLNPNIDNVLFDSSDANVIVVGIDAAQTPISLRYFFEYITSINPDYILFQTDYSYNNRKELENVAKYICNRELDCWVQTRYYSIENLHIISYQQIPRVIDGCYDLENRNNSEIIKFDILSKISYPGGIKKYK